MFITGVIYALDLDREPANVAYLNLPSQPFLDKSARTFNFDAGTSYWSDVVYENIENYFNLVGFNIVNSDPTIDIDFKFKNVFVNNTDIKTRHKETKDRNGNITNKYYYTPIIEYSTSATITVIYKDGTINNRQYGSNSIQHEGNETSSRQAATNYIEANMERVKNDAYRSFVRETVQEVDAKINALHGYKPEFAKISFLILDSKRYDEYEDYKKYYQLNNET